MSCVTDYVAAGSFADIKNNVSYMSEPDFAQLVRTVDLKKKFTNNDFVYVDKNAFDYLWRVNLNEECIVLPNIGANIGEVYYVTPSDLPCENNVLGPNAILLKTENDTYFVFTSLSSDDFQKQLFENVGSSGQPKFNKTELKSILLSIPSLQEQEKIGAYFKNLDNLITLHQREHICFHKNGGAIMMLDQVKPTDLFADYYAQWVHVYKKGAIRKVTLDKYLITQMWIEKLIPELKMCDMTRIAYQQLLNDYAEEHERQTTMDFHHQLKGAILDAVDEGLISRDPTRKVIIKGKTPTEKKTKYLNQFELHTLLMNLDLGNTINWDWFILLVAKTGMRFSEALALTPKDFDFSHQSLSICKTWDYKSEGGFLPTKNKSSVRKIQIDWQTVVQFSELLKDQPQDKPIFVTKDKVYNSTVNDILERRCKSAKVPVISVHGLRHTHASILLFAGVSIGSVARRLGHASMTTTQKTYLHIIHELENQDVDLVMRSLSSLR